MSKLILVYDARSSSVTGSTLSEMPLKVFEHFSKVKAEIFESIFLKKKENYILWLPSFFIIFRFDQER